MQPSRLALIQHDVVRSRCEACGREQLQFLPRHASAETTSCPRCDRQHTFADISDESIARLISRDSGELVLLPPIARH